jgi:hypothetical protein
MAMERRTLLHRAWSGDQGGVPPLYGDRNRRLPPGTGGGPGNVVVAAAHAGRSRDNVCSA